MSGPIWVLPQEHPLVVPHLPGCLRPHSAGDGDVGRGAALLHGIHEPGMLRWGPLSCCCCRCLLCSDPAGLRCVLVSDVLAQGPLGWEGLAAVGTGLTFVPVGGSGISFLDRRAESVAANCPTRKSPPPSGAQSAVSLTRHSALT